VRRSSLHSRSSVYSLNAADVARVGWAPAECKAGFVDEFVRVDGTSELFALAAVVGADQAAAKENLVARLAAETTSFASYWRFKISADCEVPEAKVPPVEMGTEYFVP